VSSGALLVRTGMRSAELQRHTLHGHGARKERLREAAQASTQAIHKKTTRRRHTHEHARFSVMSSHACMRFDREHVHEQLSL
jgi:hypothetical protein